MKSDFAKKQCQSIGLLAFLISAQTILSIAVQPSAGRSLGMSSEALVTSTVIRFGLVLVFALVSCAVIGDQPIRAKSVLAGSFISIAATVGAAVSGDATQWLASMALAGVGQGLFAAASAALLCDALPVATRRLLDRSRRMELSGIAASFGLVLLGDQLNLTWRGAMLCCAGCSLAVTVWCSDLVDPGVGVRDLVMSDGLGRSRWSESFTRVTSTPGVPEMLGGYLAVGQVSVPVIIWGRVWLHDRWQQGPVQSLLIMLLVACVAAGLAYRSRTRVEPLPERTADRAQEAGHAISVAVLLVVVALVVSVVGSRISDNQRFVVVVGTLCSLIIAKSLASISHAAGHLESVLVDLSVAANRTVVSGLSAAAMASGTIGGLLLGNSINRRFGAEWAVGLSVAPAILAGRRLAHHAVTVAKGRAGITNELFDNLCDSNTHKLHPNTSTQVRKNLLTATDIDVSYSGVQVLFGVSLAVEPGEMVALLGTNGAGKSTLLRAISGLVTTQRGTIRLRGVDITSLSVERRVVAGITQIPGGKAVFGPLNVVDNLKLFATSLDQRSRTIDESIELVVSTFERLAEKRNQTAETLSGGEQQMLALGKALMLSPQVLLIDELSLGLAPSIVTELLDLVRQINAAGTAVVLVEQSVNVALSIANRAVFMEKGEVQFEGPSSELLKRTDLLRAVFLGGAAAKVGASS